MTTLSPTEIEQWSRQLILPGWTADRLEQLKSKKIAVSSDLPTAVLYLIGAGVGQIAIFGPPSAVRDWIAHRAKDLNPNAGITMLSADEISAANFDHVIQKCPITSNDPGEACLKALALLITL